MTMEKQPDGCNTVGFENRRKVWGGEEAGEACRPERSWVQIPAPRPRRAWENPTSPLGLVSPFVTRGEEHSLSQRVIVRTNESSV